MTDLDCGVVGMIVDSWVLLSQKHRAVVVKRYFEKYIQVTGMLTGFQSFVMTMDTIEKTDYLPMFLMAISFLGNMSICFVSIVTCNVLSGGYYTPCFDRMSVVCMYALAVTNAFYFVSIMWSSHITFIESNLATDNVYMYMQFLYYFVAASLALFTCTYLVKHERDARYIQLPHPTYSLDVRKALIDID